MVPSLSSPTRKKLKDILDVTTNIVVVLFAIVAIGVLVKNYFAPPNVKTNVAFKKGTIFPRSRELITGKLRKPSSSRST